jgi:hypothetical protein
LSTISSPENLALIERYKAIQHRLADPRTIADEDEADQLIESGKTIVAVTCSIHATEVGATQMSLLLAHHLATSDSNEVREILDNVILLLVPSLNPDGLILVKRWYDSTIGKNYEGLFPPFLYHKYTGHDNNRDWFMFTQAETRLVVEHCLNEWHPQILFDMHQTRSNGMRMILPPFIDPIGPNIDPVIQSQITSIGTAMASELTAQGKAGVAVNVVYDAYSPNRAYQHYHAGVRLLSEAAGVRIATPVNVDKSQLMSDRGERPTERSWNHPMPWEGGRWSLGDIVDYDFAAVMACLKNAANYRRSWVRNFYEVGKKAVNKTGNPFAYLIPERQRDPGAATELLRVMETASVEIHEAQEPFTVDGAYYPFGTKVILLKQPYGAFAKTMLESRRYPDIRQYPGGPPQAPYDVAAHSLPILMGVDAAEAKSSFHVTLKKLDKVKPPKGKVLKKGNNGKYLLLRPESNASARAINRILSAGATVHRAREPIRADYDHYAPGTFVIEGSPKVNELVSKIAEQEHLLFNSLDDIPDTAMYPLRAPGAGVYKSHVPATEEGWTRYVLEEYAFSYESVIDADLRRGSLNDRFDTILIPHQRVRHLHSGHNAAQYPAKYSGGIGEAGIENLRKFVEAGGTLVAWDGAARYVVQHMGLNVSNMLAGLPSSEFFAPGSLLGVLLDTNHPIAYGMPDPAAVMFVNGPAFDVREGRVVGKFPLHNPLRSGWLIGAEKLFGKAALVSVPVGRGEVILVGFRMHFRAQARGTYKILFNSLFYSAMRGQPD